MTIGILFFLTTILTWALTGALRHYALKNSLLDLPNARSSHLIPTPRGGGLAIVITFFFTLMFFYFQGIGSAKTLLSLGGAGLIIALIGFWDDHGHISAKWRLAAHFIAACWGLTWLGGLPPINISTATSINLHWLGHFIAIIYLVWLLNLYNFMDGIDGIASLEAVSVLACSAILYLLFIPNSNDWIISITLLCSVIGFLIWNFPPAKIFMGDAGSGFLGITLGLLSIQASILNSALFWAWLILLGVFITDATTTLIRRILRGEKVYEAHRSHAYQYASRKYRAHKPVTIAVTCINIFWLFPMALIAASGAINAVFALAIAYVPLLLIAYHFKAGDSAQQQNL